MNRNVLLSVASLAFAFLGSACGARAISMVPQQRSFTDRDFQDVYEAWTREADSFSVGALEDVLNVTATFESWEFRWAYVVRYAADNSLTPDARESMLSASLSDAQLKHRFFVTLAGHNFRESDLTSDRSAWRVLLVDADGRHFVPVSMERLEHPTPAEKAYFPHVSPWRQTFRLVFDARRPDGVPVIGPNAKYVILRFTGPQGQVDLRWNLVSGEHVKALRTEQR